MSIPIIMTTYERADYFTNTLMSLCACEEDVSNLLIYDDASQSSEKQRALSACGTRIVPADTNLGPYRAFVRILRASVPISGKYLLYTQDDVEFSRKCITKGIALAELIQKDGHRLGILSLFQRAKKVHAQPYQVMPVGHPGAICWLLTSEFIGDFLLNGVDKPCEFAPNDVRKRHFIRDLVDYKVCRWAQIHGYVVAYPQRSLVQHVGDGSTLSDRAMDFCRSTNYVGVDGGEEN